MLVVGEKAQKRGEMEGMVALKNGRMFSSIRGLQKI